MHATSEAGRDCKKSPGLVKHPVATRICLGEQCPRVFGHASERGVSELDVAEMVAHCTRRYLFNVARMYTLMSDGVLLGQQLTYCRKP